MTRVRRPSRVTRSSRTGIQCSATACPGWLAFRVASHASTSPIQLRLLATKQDDVKWSRSETLGLLEEAVHILIVVNDLV
jgi:hypothetical protein